MAKTLRRPPVRGSADPWLPGHVLVPVRKEPAGFPKVNYSVPDGSFWRVDTRTSRPTSILTVTPDGVELGWDSCGVCMAYVPRCECAAGVSLPNSIAHIFISRGGVKPSAPERLPLAPVFQAPAPRSRRKKKLKRPIQEPRPKKTLKRTTLDKVAEEEAAAAVERVLKKLKR